MVDRSKPIEIELSNNEEFEIINEEKLIMEPIPELDCYGIYIEIKPKSNAGVDSFTNISATMNGYISKCKLKIKKDTLSGIRLVLILIIIQRIYQKEQRLIDPVMNSLSLFI